MIGWLEWHAPEILFKVKVPKTLGSISASVFPRKWCDVMYVCVSRGLLLSDLIPPQHYNEHLQSGYYSHPEALTPPAMSEYGPIYGESVGYASAGWLL